MAMRLLLLITVVVVLFSLFSITLSGPVTKNFDLESYVKGKDGLRKIRGSAVLVIENGEIAGETADGWAIYDHDAPMRLDSAIMVGGLTKTVTFAAVLKLVDDGLINLDDDVNDILAKKGFIIRNPYHPDIPITIRMLLTHTASIRDNWDVIQAFYSIGESNLPLQKLIINYLTREGIEGRQSNYFYHIQNWFGFEPGTLWKYSHMGATLAGYIVSVVTGQPFNEFCEETFFKPLNMFNTHFFLHEYKENISRVAHPHFYSKPFVRFFTKELYSIADYPDGGLRTTVLDYFKYMQMLMANGKSPSGQRILSAKSVERMLTYQPAIGQYIRQTMGMWHVFEGRNVIGHDGGERGYRSFAGFDPETKNGIIWFSTTWPRCECFINEIVHDLFVSWFGKDASVIKDYQDLNKEVEYETKPTPSVTQTRVFLRG